MGLTLFMMNTNAPPLSDLTFICALEPKALRALFENRFVLDDLKSLGAGVALVARDFSEERAQAVRLLNRLGIPVSAWLLLPGEQGSWVDSANPAQAAELYQALKRWSEVKGLRWSAVGFGASEALDLPPRKRGKADARSLAAGTLVDQAHADGFAVELVYTGLEAPRNHSLASPLRRGVLEAAPGVERRIWLRSLKGLAQRTEAWQPSGGANEVCVSARQEDTSLEGGEPKTWLEFARDIRAARQKSKAVYVLTLESCASQGFLDPLVTLDWKVKPQSGPVCASRGPKATAFLSGHKRWLGFAALAGFVGWALFSLRSRKHKPKK